MAETDVSTSNPAELLAVGRRHLAVRDYRSAAPTISLACELLAKEHGDMGDQCAEAYLWYGKALLGLSREERGVLGDGIPDSGNDDEDSEEQEENGENVENGDEEESNEAEAQTKNEVTSEAAAENNEVESTTKDDPAPSTAADGQASEEQPGTSNGEANDESVVDLETDEVDNLELAWEMLDLSRSILQRRVESGGDAARALLADVLLSLGEVALENETYDQAVVDMLSCLEIQKDLYKSDDRRIAETHYQIALANSLASNFEEAITHFKNAANILESRIKTLENSNADTEGKTTTPESAEAEIKELKELLPEIQVKIQDMMDYKAETKKKVQEVLYQANGEGSSSQSNGAASSTSSTAAKPATDISHLIKRKRKASETEESPAKRVNS